MPSIRVASPALICLTRSRLERQQNDSSKFETHRPNSEKSNPEFEFAEYLIFPTPFITSSRVPRSSVKHDRRDPDYWRHRISKTRAFACSRGIGLRLCLLETKVFTHSLCEGAEWERVEWGIGRRTYLISSYFILRGRLIIGAKAAFPLSINKRTKPNYEEETTRH